MYFVLMLLFNNIIELSVVIHIRQFCIVSSSNFQVTWHNGQPDAKYTHTNIYTLRPSRGDLKDKTIFVKISQMNIYSVRLSVGNSVANHEHTRSFFVNSCY